MNYKKKMLEPTNEMDMAWETNLRRESNENCPLCLVAPHMISQFTHTK